MTESSNVLSLVSYSILPAKMGGQKGIAFFNQYLAEKVTLTCVTIKNNSPSLARGYTMLNILSNSPLRYINLFYFFTLKKIIRSRSITHLIIEHPYYGWLGVLLKNFCGVKLIVHSHNIEALRWKSTGHWWWPLLWQYEKRVHKAADANFFIQDNDRNYAIEKFGLPENKCITVTYGFELSKAPLPQEKAAARAYLQKQYSILPSTKILLFNGTLSYKPNLHALNIILKEINPLLLQQNFSYKIIICGKDLPNEYNSLRTYESKNIIYAGFVNDINIFFTGADIFLNPVNDGGGIKTKLVEALGFNLNVVTTENGAIGIPPSITGAKMKVLKNASPNEFTEAIIAADINAVIPPAFFYYFYWPEIIKKTLKYFN